MMFLRRCLASDAAGGDLRDRIGALVQTVKQDPKNQVALLQLAHLYSQVWIKTQQDEAIPRIIQCLRRAISLEDGARTAQISQLIQSVSKHFVARQLVQPVTELRELHDLLAARVQMRSTTPSPPAAEPPQPDVAKKQSSSSTPPLRPSAEPAEEENVDDEARNLPVPELSVEELEPTGPGILAAAKQATAGRSTDDDREPSAPEIEVEVNVETVAPAKNEGVSKEILDKKRRELRHQEALTTAEEVSEIRELFEQERVEDILRFYAQCIEPREKRYIAEELVKRLDNWQIGPVLAIAALESDEKIFRQIMRLLLQADRAMICEQIELADYSPDLQRVASVVLGELNIRAALPKLRAGLDMEDPVVRSVAVHSLGRAGKAALQYVPDLVAAVESDPNPNVRRAAAKALAEMNQREAWQALEVAANKTRFDAPIYLELEKMRSRFSEPDKKSSASESGKSSGATSKKSESMSPQTIKNIVAVLFFLVLLSVAGFFVWSRIRNYIIPPNYVPEMREQTYRQQPPMPGGPPPREP